MSELSLREVHVFAKEPGGSQFRLTKVNPAMRLKSGAQEIYIQHGRYWTPGGVQIRSKDLPDWVRGELMKVSPAALAECGIHVDRKDEGN